jgi:hypothetical protein
MNSKEILNYWLAYLFQSLFLKSPYDMDKKAFKKHALSIHDGSKGGTTKTQHEKRGSTEFEYSR